MDNTCTDCNELTRYCRCGMFQRRGESSGSWPKDSPVAMTDTELSPVDKATILLRALVESPHWPEEGHKWGLLVSEVLWDELVDFAHELRGLAAREAPATVGESTKPTPAPGQCPTCGEYSMSARAMHGLYGTTTPVGG